MVKEPKIQIVDLLRDKFENPNPKVPSEGVFPDEPRKDLKFDSYPRIQVVDTDAREEFIGIGGNDVKITYSGQIRIYVKQTTSKDQLLKINDEVYNDHKLVDYISLKIRKILAHELIQSDRTIIDYEKLGETEPLLDITTGRYVKFINFKIIYIERYENGE